MRLLSLPSRVAGGVLSLLLVAVPPLIVLGLGWRVVSQRLDQALSQLAPLVSSEASQWLQRPVRIGTLEPVPTVRWLTDIVRRPETIGTFPVVATDVVLGATADEQRVVRKAWLARAKSITALVAAPGLTGGDPAGNALPELQVEGLDLALVRAPDGSWPIARLLPKDRRRPDPTRPPFRTKITFRNSRLDVVDLATRSRAARTLETNRFVAPEVSINLTGTRLILFEGVARAAPGTPTARRLKGELRVEGDVARGRPGISPTAPGADAGPFNVTVRANGLDMAYASTYAPVALPAKRVRGNADVVVHAMPRWGSKPDVLVRARVREFEGVLDRWPGLPVRAGAGTFEWADGRVSVRIDGDVGGVRAHADGWVDGVGAQRPVRFHVRLDPMELPVALLTRNFPEFKLPSELALPERLRVANTVVSGTPDQPRVLSSIEADGIGWKDWPALASSKVPLRWTDNQLVCGPVAARVSGGGTVAGRLRWNRDSQVGQVDMAVRGAGLRGLLANVEIPDNWQPSGQLDADVQLAFRTGLKRGVPLSGRVVGNVRRPTLGGIAFDRAEFATEVAGNRIALRRARLGGDTGLLDLTGDVEIGGDVRLVARAVGIDIARIADNAGWPEASGVLNGLATVVGRPDAPEIRLEDFSILGPRVIWDGRDLSADSLRCERVEVSRERGGRRWSVRMATPLRLALAPAELLVQGTVAYNGTQTSLDLTAQATQLDIERILPVLVARQVAWAPAWLRDDPAWMSVASDFGWISPPPDVRGRLLTADAKVGGTWDDPRVDGQFDVRRARFADVPVDSLQGQLSFVGGDWKLTGVEADAPLGSLRAEAGLLADGRLSGELQVRPLRLGALAAWTKDSVTLGGAVGITATLSGSRQNPVLAGSLQVVETPSVGGAPVTDLKAGDWRLSGSVDEESRWSAEFHCDKIDARLAGSTFAVTGIQWKYPEPVAAADVVWRIFGLKATAEELRQLPELPDKVNGALRRLAADLPDDIDMAASANARVSLGGAGNAPQWQAAVEIRGDNARVGPVQFPVATASLAWSGQKIDIRGVRLEGPAAIVEGGGILTLPDSENGPVGWDIRLESLSPSLELIRAFDPDFPLFGELDAVTVVARGNSDDPQIQATAEGSRIVVKSPDQASVVLDRLRVNARVYRGGDGDLLLAIDDGLVVRGDEQIGWDVELPVDPKGWRILASRPIRRMEARAIGVRMATLASFGRLPVEDVEGVLSGSLALSGTLNQPSLKGDLRVANASARFTKIGSSRRHPANDIADMAIHLEASGRDVFVREARVAFGPPEGQRTSPGGVVDVRGSIRLDNLEDFTRLFTRRDTDQAPPQVRGAYNLSANLAAIRPDIDNLSALAGIRDIRGQLGLAESGRATVNGQVLVTGSLLEPEVSTPTAKPLQLTDVFLRLPRPSSLASTRSAPPIDPRWRIQMTVPGDARVVLTDTPVVRLEFLGRGDVELAGALSAPTIVGTLAPTGGYLRYPLARLDLQRGGTARISYGNQRVAVVLSGVSAEGKITGVGTQTGRRSDSGLVNVGLGAAGTGLETTYRIEATFNGAVDLTGTSGTDLLRQVVLSAEPPLNRQQILELLGARRQFDLFAAGDIEQAMLGIGRRFADTGLVSGLFRPLTSNVRSAFGLDVFDLNYSLDGTAFVRVVRRLPEPMDRFTVEFGQSFLSRDTSANRLPYRFGVNYELFQFQQRRWFVPRLLLGFAASSEQRDTLTFVRGTVNY